MYKKIFLSGLLSLILAVSSFQLMANIGGDCSARQLDCCPEFGQPQLIHCQNMWNGDVFCAYDNDTVIDVTECAAGLNGSGSVNEGVDTEEGSG